GGPRETWLRWNCEPTLQSERARMETLHLWLARPRSIPINNAFVKIQSQNGSGTTFDTAAFYTGNNGGGFFFTLSSPVPSPAIVDVYFCGSTAKLKISSSAGIQTYTHDYGTTFPSGVCLGTFGSVQVDNFTRI